MEKKKSIQCGRIWLNVFTTQDRQSLVTINKAYMKEGEWKTTPFFNVEKGDLASIKQAIAQFEQSISEEVVL